MRRESVFVVASFCIALLHVTRPSDLPPTFRVLSSLPAPTLDTLILGLPNSPTTPLHASYKKFSRCAFDLPALRKAISQTAPIHHTLVICVSRPLTTDYLHFIRTLSARLGAPYVTTTDGYILSRLASVNVTPTLPSTPDEALAAMATAENLLVTSALGCAFGARVARGVVYYTQEYHRFIALHGYEWLPENPARLDGYDRSHRAVLSATGKPEETCCSFRNGVCHPLPRRCRAVVMGELHDEIACHLVHVCRKGECPKWVDIVKAGVPHLLVMDIAGREFDMLKQVCGAGRLPEQIVLRMRVWASYQIDQAWVAGKQGWVVKRHEVIEVVHQLRKSGYRLVHRVDDPGCEWCTFLTFLRQRDDARG